MPSTLRQLFLHARRANVRGVHILHHRVFGIPTKHLVAHRPDLSWIVRNRLHSSAALVDASRGTPMRRLASTAKPIWAISLSCGGTDSDEATIFGDGSWLTTLIKSPVASMRRRQMLWAEMDFAPPTETYGWKAAPAIPIQLC